MPPGRVKLTAGTDAMRCLRLSSKVLRWYTDCCRTPIGNTAAGPRFPVVALIHSFMDHESDHRSRADVLGPPLCGIFERSAVGPLPPNAPPPPSLRLFARRGDGPPVVGARARPADTVLRRSDEGSTCGGARAHAERARRSLKDDTSVATPMHAGVSRGRHHRAA
jgi:hypothetical protein